MGVFFACRRRQQSATLAALHARIREMFDIVAGVPTSVLSLLGFLYRDESCSFSSVASRLGETLWSSMPSASWATPSTGGAYFFGAQNAEITRVSIFVSSTYRGRIAWPRAADCDSQVPSTACRGRTRAGLPCAAPTASPLRLGSATLPAW